MKPYLILDKNLDLNSAVALGIDMRDIRNENIKFFTSPTLGTGVSGDGQSIVLPNGAEMERVKAALREGTLHQYAAQLQP